MKETVARYILSAGTNYQHKTYCDNILLNYLGASSVDSVDNSDYQNASIVHDMNLPVPAKYEATYDTVIDGGVIEHIYNIPQALSNCSALCKPGGQIIHIAPANNFCGHGFWQISPELFFSLYSEENGYTNTEVYLADLTNLKTWFKVKPPSDGYRVDVHGKTPLYALVRTVRK
ncbi:MAG: hypothetical protein ACR2P6_04695, partial [Gammaproteobacteria bacterium]